MNDTATQKSVLTLAITSSFMTPFMVSSINVALPSIEREFKIDAVLLSWVATSYILASAIALVPFGKIADIYGRKRVFTCGIVIWCLFHPLCCRSFCIINEREFANRSLKCCNTRLIISVVSQKFHIQFWQYNMLTKRIDRK